MQVEDRLARAAPDVDADAVVLEADLARRLRDELEHPLGLFGRELTDLAKRVHVPFRDDEQVRLGSRIDVTDGDEAVGDGDVLPLADEAAEEALVRQRGSPSK
jgi:hypothetical protein